MRSVDYGAGIFLIALLIVFLLSALTITKIIPLHNDVHRKIVPIVEQVAPAE